MRKDIFNFKISSQLQTVGKYDMPVIQKCDLVFKCEFLIIEPFNHILSDPDPHSKLCHFYIDDYQFERVWRKPEVYLPLLKNFNGVIGSDFSMYVNMPLPQQIHNNWRNKVLMAYWQSQGIKVIPNVQWSDERSFDFCFDGLPHGGVMAICTTGCHMKEAHRLFLQGYGKMCEVLKPDKIICVGKPPPEIENDKKLIYFNSFMEQRRKTWAEEEARSKQQKEKITSKQLT